MNDNRLFSFSRICGDAGIAIGAYYAAFWLRMHVHIPFTEKLLPAFNFQQLPHYWWIVMLLQVAFLYFLGGYDSDNPDHGGLSPKSIVSAATLTTLVLIAFYFFIDVRFPRTIFLVFWGLDVPALFLWHGLLRKMRTPTRKQRALLVGVNETSHALVRELQRRPWLGLEVVGLIDEKEPLAVPSGGVTAAEPQLDFDVPVLGRRDNLAELVEKHEIEHVILTPTPSWQDRLIDELEEFHKRRGRVTLVPSPFEIIIGKPQGRRVHDIPLIDFLREPMGPASRFMKRAMDLFGATLLLSLVWPILVGTAIAIKLAAPGPVLFRQTRVGRHGKLFSIVKFRTMIVDAEKKTGAVLASKDDPRVYPLGKFLRKTRIDELPQLFNILAGQMSFVGPRPERPEFVEEFRRDIPGYAERLRVKPGVTGLAQVNGYYETTTENKLKFDLSYIYNYSIWLDIRILLETVKVVLTARGT